MLLRKAKPESSNEVTNVATRSRINGLSSGRRTSLLVSAKMPEGRRQR